MKKLILVLLAISSICILFPQSGLALNHHSETMTPIIAQYFNIKTEHGQKWEDKFRDDTPFNKLNRLYLAYGRVIKGSDHHHWIRFDGDEQRALAVLKRVKEVNPKAEIFLVLHGDDGPNSFGGAAHDDKFAGNALSFLQKYQFDGLDIDWRNATDKAKLSSLLTNLYNTLHPAGFKLTMDVWQYVAPAYDIPYIKDYLDQINIMSYGTGIRLDVCVSDYMHSGFPARKMLGGVESEVDYSQFGGVTDTLGMRGTIEQKAMFAKATIAGMAGWRLDNDYVLKSNLNYPTYKGAIALWEEMTNPRSHGS